MLVLVQHAWLNTRKSLGWWMQFVPYADLMYRLAFFIHDCVLDEALALPIGGFQDPGFTVFSVVYLFFSGIQYLPLVVFVVFHS